MKQFDPTKPYCRRDGKPARIICIDAKGPRPIVVLYPDGADLEGIYRVNIDGTEWGSGLGQQSKFDLINIPEKIERWQNIYVRDGRYYNTGALYTTFEEATNRARIDTVACIKVTFTEGEGLE